MEIQLTGVLVVAAGAFAVPLGLGFVTFLRLPSVVLEIVVGILIGPVVLRAGRDRYAAADSLPVHAGLPYGRALAHMTGGVAHDGGEQEAGHYRIGYALEEAERMYEWTGGELVWRDPGDELRKWFGHEADRWAGFLKRYRAELEEAGKTEELREIGERAAERNVTLLLGARDTEHNNARGSRPSCASSVVQRRGLGN